MADSILYAEFEADALLARVVDLAPRFRQCLVDLGRFEPAKPSLTLINKTSASMHIVREYVASDGSRVLQLGSSDILKNDTQRRVAADDGKELATSQANLDDGAAIEAADDGFDRD